MLRNLLNRLARQPMLSWQRFKRGLILFGLGVALILSGAKWWVWLQLPGILMLGAGIAFAAWGYAGLLAYRLTQAFNRPAPPSLFDK